MVAAFITKKKHLSLLSTGAAPLPARVGEFSHKCREKLAGLLQKFFRYAILFWTNHTSNVLKTSNESKSSRLDPWDGIGGGEIQPTEKGSFYVPLSPPSKSTTAMLWTCSF